MYFQATSLSTGFTTIFAGMRLLSAMDKLMSFQVASLSKMFTTIFAGMWFVSVMFNFRTNMGLTTYCGFRRKVDPTK